MRWPWSKPKVKMVVYRAHGEEELWLWEIQRTSDNTALALCPMPGWDAEFKALDRAKYLLDAMMADRVEVVINDGRGPQRKA